jgi:hypothetical protein
VNDRPAGSTDPVELWAHGANRVPKAAGAGVAFSPGALVYFDSSTGLAVEADGFGRFLLGVCTDPANAAAHPSVTVLVVPFAEAILSASSGMVAHSTAQGPIVANDSDQQVVFELDIAANAVKVGRCYQFWFVVEVLTRTTGDLRLRAVFDALGGTQLISGFYPITSVDVDGFAFTDFSVVDTGAGPTASRWVSASIGGVDVIVDLTVPIKIVCTAEMTVASAGDTWRGVHALLSAV